MALYVSWNDRDCGCYVCDNNGVKPKRVFLFLFYLFSFVKILNPPFLSYEKIKLFYKLKKCEKEKKKNNKYSYKRK